MLQGRFGEAQGHIEAAGSPEHPRVLAALVRLRAHQGDRRKMELTINEPALSKAPSVAGAGYAVLGDRSRAEDFFAQAFQRKDPNLPYLIAEPDPRLDDSVWLRTHAAILGIKRG